MVSDRNRNEWTVAPLSERTIFTRKPWRESDRLIFYGNIQGYNFVFIVSSFRISVDQFLDINNLMSNKWKTPRKALNMILICSRSLYNVSINIRYNNGYSSFSLKPGEQGSPRISNTIHPRVPAFFWTYKLNCISIVLIWRILCYKIPIYCGLWRIYSE